MDLDYTGYKKKDVNVSFLYELLQGVWSILLGKFAV